MVTNDGVWLYVDTDNNVYCAGHVRCEGDIDDDLCCYSDIDSGVSCDGVCCDSDNDGVCYYGDMTMVFIVMVMFVVKVILMMVFHCYFGHRDIDNCVSCDGVVKVILMIVFFGCLL